MATIGAVTRQIAALEISSKKPATASSSSSANPVRPGHSKQPSQEKVTKLLSKFAAPVNPNGTSKLAPSSSLRKQMNEANQTHASEAAPHKKASPAPPEKPIDIGKYDGGLEKENEERGEQVYGDAAKQLALDSSVAKCVSNQLFTCTHTNACQQALPDARVDAARLRHRAPAG